MASNYVYSTLTNDQVYTGYHPTSADQIPMKSRTVVIKGGANIRKEEGTIITPLGSANEVSDDDLAFLKAHPAFQVHLKNGHLKIDAKKVEIEKVVADMERSDKSAPLNDVTMNAI